MHVIDKALDYATKQERRGEVCSAPDLIKDVKAISQKARRFVFGTAESEFVGKFIREFGDVIINNRQFAIPPFENTYIEFDVVALLRGIGGRTTHDEAEFQDRAYDAKHGFLINQNHVYSATEDSDGHVMLSPLHFYFNSHSTNFNQFSDDQEENDWQKLAFCLGTTLHQLPDEEARLDLINSIDLQCSIPALFRQPRIHRGFWGEIRNLFALLLILNKRSDSVQFLNVAPKGILYKGKRHVFMAHSIVKILLGEKESVTRAFTGLTSRDSPRRHQVRGFFRNYHQDKTCEHSFPLIPNEKEQWICPKCGTIRVWIKEFERGDASKGYVTKEYQAKTRLEEN